MPWKIALHEISSFVFLSPLVPALIATHVYGLAALTPTPSPMKFLNQILHRPSNKKPFMLIVDGFLKEGITLLDIERKSFDEIASIMYFLRALNKTCMN